MILRRKNVEIVVDDELEIQQRKAEGFVEILVGARVATTEIPYEPEEFDFEAMTVKELHKLAKAKGIQGATSLRKADLIEALREV